MSDNWLDSFINFVAPQAGAKRARARGLIKTYEKLSKRKYDAAGFGPRNSGWTSAGTSSNTEIGAALSTLRARSRDLVRNNGYAARAVQVVQANVVGSGIVAKVTGQRTPEELKRIQGLWDAWAESTKMDADGRHDLYGIQSLAMRAIAESGECVIRRRRRRSTQMLDVPLQIQVLEGDFIDSTQERRLSNGNVIIQGIEFDNRGKRVAYYLHTEHPGGVIGRAFSFRSVRVPADEILHVYRVDRAGQVRGVPWGAPVLTIIRDLDDFQQARLVNQKVSACFTAFVHDIDTSELSDEDKDLAQKVEPGMIEFLPPGKEVTFGNPSMPSGYNEYTSTILHAIAAGYGITHEQLTGDLSGVNFSSGRMGHLEFQRNVDQWRWNMLIPSLCAPIFNWFVQSAGFAGLLDPEGLSAEWTAPAREMIDPVKEVSANVTAMRSGQKSLFEVLREQGMNPESVLNEIKSSNDMLDSLGIVLDSDPRHINKSGGTQTVDVMGDENEE